MKLRTLLVVGWWGVAVGALAGVRPADFPYRKTVQPPTPVDRAALAGVELDDEVLAELNDARSNLRLWEDEAREWPVLIQPRTERRRVVVERTENGTPVSFKEQPDNRAELVVTRAQTAGVPVALLLHSTQANYEKQIDVFGSNDQQTWVPLATNQPVFDYTRYIDVRNARVNLEPGSWTYYRVVIANLAENRRTAFTEVIRQMRGADQQVTETETTRVRQEPFRVERLEFVVLEEREQEEQPVLTRWDVADFTVDEQGTAQVTRVRFDTRRQPLVKLWLFPTDPNFSRRVTVAGSDEEGPEARWTTLAATTLSRVQAGSVHQPLLAVDLGGVRRFQHYEITIHNHDNPPLEIQSIQVEGETWDAVFFPPAGSLRLLYGGTRADRPEYDLAAVLAAAPRQVAQRWTLGETQANPDYRAEPEVKRALSGRIVLVLSILAMVALLFRVLAKTARQVDAEQTKP